MLGQSNLFTWQWQIVRDFFKWVRDLALIFITNNMIRSLLLHLVKSFITYLWQVLHILSGKNVIMWTPNSMNSTFIESISASPSLSVMSVILLHLLSTINQAVLWVSAYIAILALTSILVFHIWYTFLL